MSIWHSLDDGWDEDDEPENGVEITAVPSGKLSGIICEVKDCIYNRSCANHTTAGDFRSEDGFSPELTEKDGKIFCASKNRKSMSDIKYETLPENYLSLGQGMLVYQDGKIVLDPYRLP